MKWLTLKLLHLLLRVFFRRVEVVGEDQLPTEGGLVFAPNHPNALIDPLFLLVLPPKQVAFLAKEPLFRMPVVGTFVRALGCLPVYRAKDGHDTAANERSLRAAREVLATGRAIGIFPEGISHSEAALQPLKTGAARIALGAAAGTEQPVFVVPCALHYAAKTRFRSQAALVYGQPLPVPQLAVDSATGQPPRDAVRELTEAVDRGLRAIVLQAETPDVLALVAIASRLFEGARRARGETGLPQLDGDEGAGPVERSLRLQRQMLGRYAEWQGRNPELIHGLAERVQALELAYAVRGLDLRDPLLEDARAHGAPRAVPWLLLAAPLALLGTVVHYPVYRAVGALALRTAGEDTDVVASAKLLLGMLAFPGLWLLITLAVGLTWGSLPALVALLMSPLSAWLALVSWEHAELWLSARTFAAQRPSAAQLTNLNAERNALYEELLTLDEAPETR